MIRQFSAVLWMLKLHDMNFLRVHLTPAATRMERCTILLWINFLGGGKGVTEDEMVGWHHQLNGHELE